MIIGILEYKKGILIIGQYGCLAMGWERIIMNIKTNFCQMKILH